jgi:hypothetical protein
MRGAVGFMLCVLWSVVGLTSLAIALSGFMAADPAGALLRTLGGFVGFFAVFALTLFAMSRS